MEAALDTYVETHVDAARAAAVDASLALQSASAAAARRGNASGAEACSALAAELDAFMRQLLQPQTREEILRDRVIDSLCDALRTILRKDYDSKYAQLRDRKKKAEEDQGGHLRDRVAGAAAGRAGPSSGASAAFKQQQQGEYHCDHRMLATAARMRRGEKGRIGRHDGQLWSEDEIGPVCTRLDLAGLYLTKDEVEIDHMCAPYAVRRQSALPPMFWCLSTVPKLMLVLLCRDGLLAESSCRLSRRAWPTFIGSRIFCLMCVPAALACGMLCALLPCCAHHERERRPCVVGVLRVVRPDCYAPLPPPLLRSYLMTDRERRAGQGCRI